MMPCTFALALAVPLLCLCAGATTHQEHAQKLEELRSANDVYMRHQQKALWDHQKEPVVDEEGVMHKRGPVHKARPFEWDLRKLQMRHEGTHEQQEVGSSYRVFYEYDGERISPWHSIPLHARGYRDDRKLFHFVCEIPKGETAKFEVHKSFDYNPIAQDIKKGKLRFYKYGPSLVNYGALMQTWEDPNLVHPDTGAGGDNDPIDVLQINETPCKLGEVMAVRVLGTLALVDGGETDWKLIVVNDADKSTAQYREIEDVPKEKIDSLREWFRNYKTAEGKPPNRFGLGEKAMSREYAERVILETHESWRGLIAAQHTCSPALDSAAPQCPCQFDDAPCWAHGTLVIEDPPGH